MIVPIACFRDDQTFLLLQLLGSEKEPVWISDDQYRYQSDIVIFHIVSRSMMTGLPVATCLLVTGRSEIRIGTGSISGQGYPITKSLPQSIYVEKH